MKNNFRWLYDHVTYQEILKKRFLAHPQLISKIASILAVQKQRSLLKAPSIAARVLVVGNTSSGKTHLSNLIGEILKIPCCRMNLGNIVPEAYKGLSFSDGLMPLIENPNNRKRAERSSCIVLDEIDKLIRRDGRDNFYQGIQQSLLGILNGEVIQSQDNSSYSPRTISFNTNNCITLLCGVFPEVSKRTWGNLESARKGLVRYGFSHEFASRITHFLYLPALDDKQIREYILIQSREVGDLYRTGNLSPSLTANEITSIAKKVKSSPFGLRASRGHLHEAFEKKVIREGFKYL